MRFERRVEIDVRDDLAVDRQKRVVFEELACVVDCAARTEDHGFLDVTKLNAKRAAVTECRTNRLRPVMEVYNYVVKTVSGDVLRDITDEWFTKNRNSGFGAIFGKRPEACAVTGGKNYRAHRGSYEALDASRITRSNVPGETLRKRVLRLSDTATLMVGFWPVKRKPPSSSRL